MDKRNILHEDLVPVLTGSGIWSVGLRMSRQLIKDIKAGLFDDDRLIILEPWEAKDFRRSLKAIEREVAENG